MKEEALSINKAAFNKSVQELIDLRPEFEVVSVIKSYMRQCGGISYYEALERLGDGIGIEYRVVEATNPRTGKAIGYWPTIEYLDGRTQGNGSTVKFGLHPYKDPAKCHYYLATQYAYALNDTPNLAVRVLGNPEAAKG